MKVLYFSKNDAKAAFLCTVYCLLGLLIGLFTGLIFFALLLAAVPVLIIAVDRSAKAAATGIVLALFIFWFIADGLSFIYIGMALAIGLGLLMWYAFNRPQLELFAWAAVAPSAWLLLSELVVRGIYAKSLLAMTHERLTQTLAEAHESFANAANQSPETVAQFGEMMQEGLEMLIANWPMFLAVFVVVSALCSLSVMNLIRTRSAAWSKVRWSEMRAPWILSAASIIAGLLFYFAPIKLLITPAQHVFHITMLLLVLSAFFLAGFYMRHMRVPHFIVAIFAAYLVFTPMLWRVFFLLGMFDSVFDYRAFLVKEGDSQ